MNSSSALSAALRRVQALEKDKQNLEKRVQALEKELKNKDNQDKITLQKAVSSKPTWETTDFYLSLGKPTDYMIDNLKHKDIETVTIIKDKNLLVSINATATDKEFNVTQEDNHWLPITSDTPQKHMDIHMFLGNTDKILPKINCADRDIETITIVKDKILNICLSATAYDKDNNFICKSKNDLWVVASD